MKKLNHYILFIILLPFTVYSATNDEKSEYTYLKEFRLSEKSVSSVENFNRLIQNQFSNLSESPRESFKLLISKTIELARELNYEKGLANASYSLGKYYIGNENNYAKAIPLILESLSIFEKLNDSSAISNCYMQIGLTSYIMQYYEDAIKNFERSIKYSSNTTSIYLMAISYSELGMFEKSKYYFSKAINDFKKKNKKNNIAECYMYLGQLYNKKNILDSAFYFLKRSIDIKNQLFERPNLVRPFTLMSETFLKNNQVDSAIYYARISYQKTKESSDILTLTTSAKTLSKAYKLKGDYRKAYFFLDQYHTLNNNHIEGNIKQKVAEMNSKFDFKKKIHNEKLKHQKEIFEQTQTKNITLISSFFLIVLAGGLYSRLRYIRKSNSTLEKERDRSDNLLLNILPAEIAQELKDKGRADARNFEMVSILFTDFKGFTKTSETLSATELVEQINICYEAFDAIIDKYSIEKIKTIGDSYMAAGGLPVPYENSVKNTVLAALEMQSFMRKYLQERSAYGQIGFEMRLGIHTGPVVAGIVGIKKFQYDVWGDTVNTASRMETSGEVGKVNISQNTYHQIKDDPLFKFEYRGKVKAKGKGEIDMYFVEKSDKKIDY